MNIKITSRAGKICNRLKLPARWQFARITGVLLLMTTVGAMAANSSTNPPTDNVSHSASASQTQTWLTFGLDRVEWLRTSVIGNPLWQYLAALIYIVLAFQASKLLDYLIHVQLRKLAAKTKTEVDDLILELVREPVKLISFVILLHIGLRVFAWPEWTESFISNGLKIIVVHWWDSTYFKEYLLQFQKLNLNLKRSFDAESISFAFPSQTVYLRQDSEWRLADGGKELSQAA